MKKIFFLLIFFINFSILSYDGKYPDEYKKFLEENKLTDKQVYYIDNFLKTTIIPVDNPWGDNLFVYTLTDDNNYYEGFYRSGGTWYHTHIKLSLDFNTLETYDNIDIVGNPQDLNCILSDKIIRVTYLNFPGIPEPTELDYLNNICLFFDTNGITIIELMSYFSGLLFSLNFLESFKL